MRIWPFSEIHQLKVRLCESNKQLHRILGDTAVVLAEKGVYMYNESGTGDLSYGIGNRVFEFNRFAWKFRGFTIDKEQVTLPQFLKAIKNAVPNKGVVQQHDSD